MLQQAYRDADPDVVLEIIDALEFGGSRFAIDALRPLVDHPNPEISARAREAIYMLK